MIATLAQLSYVYSMSKSKVEEQLSVHHGGAHFHDLMVDSFARRFDDSFWKLWQEDVASQHGDKPVYVDLGCGPGLMLNAWRERYSGAVLHGADLQSYMLESAKKNAVLADAVVHEGDLHQLRLPLADASVDAVLLSMVLHEMLEPIGVLREARRLLKPAGRLVILDWIRAPLSQYLQGDDEDVFSDATSFEKRMDRFTHFMEHNKYCSDDLSWILQQLGFEVRRLAPRNDGQHIRLVAVPA